MGVTVGTGDGVGKEALCMTTGVGVAERTGVDACPNEAAGDPDGMGSDRVGLLGWFEVVSAITAVCAGGVRVGGTLVSTADVFWRAVSTDGLVGKTVTVDWPGKSLREVLQATAGNAGAVNANRRIQDIIKVRGIDMRWTRGGFQMYQRLLYGPPRG